MPTEALAKVGPKYETPVFTGIFVYNLRNICVQNMVLRLYNPTMNIKNKNFVKLINKLKPFRAQVSACIIDLKTGERLNYNEDELIYPASTYKIFIGTEVLRQVEQGNLKLKDKIIIKSPNDIDNEARFYPTDEFPILKAGDLVDIDTLLNLMLSRSDNTASNTLIDLVSRESISENIVQKNGWIGSDVTRKFLNRLHENKKYRYADITRTCGKHLAEFIQKLHNDELVSSFVSQKLKEYMAIGMDKKMVEQFPHRGPDKRLTNTLYEKGGWIQAFSPRLPKLIRRKFYIRYQSQAGMVKIKDKEYSIGIVSKYSTIFPNRYFKMAKITQWLSNQVD